MALTPENEKKIEDIFKKNLLRARNEGIRIGILTASKVVLDKLNDSSKPLMERINSIKKYCTVATKNEKAFLNNETSKESQETTNGIAVVDNSEEKASTETTEETVS
ncbi:MAG: hypothetical protein II304_12285 [Bacteroidales bacterium]|nr:hypothetical protein [Bacteroidales bacterium]